MRAESDKSARRTHFLQRHHRRSHTVKLVKAQKDEAAAADEDADAGGIASSNVRCTSALRRRCSRWTFFCACRLSVLR
jgi:hypothetical protein